MRQILLLLVIILATAACSPKNYPAATDNGNTTQDSVRIPRVEEVFKPDSSFYDPNPTMERR